MMLPFTTVLVTSLTKDKPSFPVWQMVLFSKARFVAELAITAPGPTS